MLCTGYRLPGIKQRGNAVRVCVFVLRPSSVENVLLYLAPFPSNLQSHLRARGDYRVPNQLMSSTDVWYTGFLCFRTRL